MNLKLHLVLSDITGVTGQKIIRAILEGERDPAALAAMRDEKCKNSAGTIAKALIGNYREEHLFALRVAFELWLVYQKKLIDCDRQIEEQLSKMGRSEPEAKRTETEPKPPTKRRKNQLHFDAQAQLKRITGPDLTLIEGFQTSTVLTIISETGTDMSKWPTDGHFVSWLALCSNNRITGGKKLKKKGPKPQPNRAAQAFRLAAQTVARSQTAIGAFFRRILARGGWDDAVKATAHKLARIFYAMLKNKTEFKPLDANYYEQRYRERLLKSLEKKALSFGFTLTPTAVVH
jgi:transposase